MPEGVELATAYVSLTIDGSKVTPQVRRQFGSVGREADRAGRQAGSTFGRRFSEALKSPMGSVTSLLGAGALLGIAKDSVQLEASFSKTMAQIRASTGAGGRSIDDMRKLAMKLGADTKFSANEAADSMLELAKAGISTKDIMGGALQGTLTLAAAGDTDLATAATIASNAMNTFNLRGRDMSKIAAALAGGANASSASVESLGQGLSQVGPAATNAGLTLNDTVAALSAFDAAGIKGSDAGTSLKTMLTALVPQTTQARREMHALGLNFQDAQGNIVPLTNVAQQLHDKLSGLSQAQRIAALNTIFGSDASRAATVLMKQGEKGLRGYIKATQDQGAAEKMAKANMSGTAGAMEQLSGAIETAELALGQALAPTIQKTAHWLSDDLLPPLTKFIGQMQDGKGAGGDFADFLGDLADAGEDFAKATVSTAGPLAKDLLPALKTGAQIAGTLAHGLDELPDPLKSLAVEATLAAVAWKKLVLPARGQVLGMASATTSGVTRMQTSLRALRTDVAAMSTEYGRMGRSQSLMTSYMSQTTGPAQRVRTQLAGLGSAAKAAAGIGGMMLLTDSLGKGASASTTFETALGGAATGLATGGVWGAAIGGAAGLLGGLWRQIHHSNTELSASRRIAKEAAGGWDTLTASLNKNTGAFTKNSAAAAAADVMKDPSGQKLASYLKDYGISQQTLGKALIGNVPALKQVNQVMGLLYKSTDDLKAKNADLRKSLDMSGVGFQRWQAYLSQGGTMSLKEYTDSIKHTIKANEGLIAKNNQLDQTWRDQSRSLGQKQNEFRKNRAELKAYKLEEKGIPKEIATVFTSTTGPALKRIRELIKTYGITPKEVRTLAKAEGVDTSSKAFRGLIDLAKSLDSQHPDVHVTAQTRAAIDALAAVEAKLKNLNGDVATTYIRTVHTESRADNGGKSPGSNASGTPYWRGGWTWVGENGRELINLPTGTEIYSHQRSERMIGRNAAGAAPSAGPVPTRMALTITNWDEGTGYLEAVADDRVAAAAAMSDQMSRAVYS